VAERRTKTMRDMAISMGLLVVVVLVFVGIYGGFSFAPGGPTTDGAAPTADVVGGFQRADRNLDFKPSVPVANRIPADWHPNSFAVTDPNTLAPGDLPTVRGGWLTANGAFVTLVEAEGQVPAVLQAELGTAGSATGTVDAGGSTWTVVPGRRDETAWYREVSGGVVYLITGSAGPDAFRTLASALG
jgi:hypothetical protein